MKIVFQILLENQLIKPESLIPRIAMAILAVLLVAALVIFGAYHLRSSDPYVKSVLSLKGDSVQGQAIFLMNCSGCHGVKGNGNVGPSLRDVSDRKSEISLIRQVISGQTPPMPQFQPKPQEMADLLEYLKSL